MRLPALHRPRELDIDTRISDATVFWIFLGITTGGRLEEIGQGAIADLKQDGEFVYLDIDRVRGRR